uniref:Reverse transcriptase domain-containing protein n=1 Tax=Tanacetum cinerariifolium TaxID=118510 RepID=A0A699GK87_TANCI|nr:hypothetical protein [Tanacetum cinerariifolium]
MIEKRNELFKAMQSMFEEYRQREHAANLSTHTPKPSRSFNSICYDDDDYDYEESTIPLNAIISQIPPSILITTSHPVLPIKDLEVSFIMGNEELNTIPEKESDEFVKSSVEDLVPIPSESEDTSRSDSECILPSYDDFSPINVFEEKSVTFSNPLFNSNDNFTFNDEESLSDEDVLDDKVKIYSNPLFEFDDECISSNVNPLFDEVLEDIECKDSYDSNLDESTFLVTPLSDVNKDEYFIPGDDIELLLYRDSSTPMMSVVSILEGFIDEPPLEENDDLFDLESKKNKCASQEPFVFNQDPDENSSQSPPHIDHHCCYRCGDSLDGIFCQRCTCESCGNDAHIGYNCPPKLPIISNPEPCHNQNVDEFPQTLLRFHPTCYSGDENSFDYASTPHFVNDSPNVFNPPPQPPTYSYEFCGNDAHYSHNCPPQVPFIYNQKPWNRPAFYNYDDDDDEDYTIAITPVLSNEEPIDSLIMEDDHLDTISETESDKVIKSSVEDLVPIPREAHVHLPNMLPTHPTLMLDSDFIPSYNSLLESEIFCFDIKEKNSGSTTIHVDISLPDVDHFHFKIEPDPGELTGIVNSEIRENVLSATNVNLPPRMANFLSSLMLYGSFFLFSHIPLLLHIFSPQGMKIQFLTLASPIIVSLL